MRKIQSFVWLQIYLALSVVLMWMYIFPKRMKLDGRVNIMGKGDKPRDLIYTQEYRDNFDKIFGKKKPKKEVKNETDSKRKR